MKIYILERYEIKTLKTFQRKTLKRYWLFRSYESLCEFRDLCKELDNTCSSIEVITKNLHWEYEEKHVFYCLEEE